MSFIQRKKHPPGVDGQRNQSASSTQLLQYVLVRNGSADRAYISFGLEIRLFTNNVIVSANCYDLHNRLVVALLTTLPSMVLVVPMQAVAKERSGSRSREEEGHYRVAWLII